jgi:hypothetical protein
MLLLVILEIIPVLLVVLALRQQVVVTVRPILEIMEDQEVPVVVLVVIHRVRQHQVVQELLGKVIMEEVQQLPMQQVGPVEAVVVLSVLTIVVLARVMPVMEGLGVLRP